MTPYFSLILPIYNVAPYLKRCIDSILSQNFKDYEIILVDDGSTDDSPQICDAYAESLSNVRVIHKVNGGLSSARNAGLEIAEGQYIWWIDSDDWIEPGALEQLYIASFEKTPDIVKFHYFRVEHEPNEVPSNAEPGEYIGNEAVDVLLQKAFFTTGKYLLSACFHIYRRAFLANAHVCFDSERAVGSEDYLFNLSLLPMAKSVFMLSKPLYSYFLRNGSLTQTYKKDLYKRYVCLHNTLSKIYQTEDMLDRHQSGLSFFFVWHLVRGTCMTQEYQLLQGYDAKEGRKQVRKMLSSKELQSALTRCDKRSLSRKQKAMLLAMRLKMEWFFYYLFVIKPKVAK